MGKGKWVAFVLAAMLAIGSLSACSNDPNTGTYKLTSFMGFSTEEYHSLTGQDMSDLMEIELKSGGNAIIITNGESGNAKWKLSGDELTITDNEEELTGTLTDGKLTLYVNGVELVFEKQEE